MLIELMKSRRTVHEYKVDKIEDNIILQAIELALYAPNHKHTQPWRFFRLGQSQRLKIADLALQLKSSKQEISPAISESIRKKFLNPAELIVLGRKYTEEAFQDKEDFASLACAVQNMSLYLWSQNIGSKWSSGPITKHSLVYELIKSTPQKIVLEGFFWAGWPERVGPTPPKAKLETCWIDLKN